MKNNPSFYEKQHVVLWETTRRFMKNDTSFCEEQHVVLESIFCSIGKSPKLGIRCEKLKINSYFCQTQPQDKKKYKFFIEIFGSSKKHFTFAISIYHFIRFSLSKSYS
jgi:hypothetical protein